MNTVDEPTGVSDAAGDLRSPADGTPEGSCALLPSGVQGGARFRGRVVAFTFLAVAWELHLYETRDPRHGEVTPRAAAYCLEDPVPRGPRRTWTVAGGSLEPWGWTYEGDWPELDEEATRAMRGGGAA